MAGNPFGDTPLGLHAEIMNLARILLRPFILRIPPFQRPYTWAVKEVSQLIDDLMAAYRREATYYFIGQIVLVKQGRELDICDGQQRLTTLTMILAYARDRLPEHAALYQQLIIAAANVGRLRLKPSDAEFFAYWVHTPGRMAELGRLERFDTDSQECMIIAAREIAFALGPDEIDDRQLNAFIRYIAQRATFDVVDADEPGGAATVFETMNNRGMGLSGADILKGALLATPDLTHEEVRAFASKWEALEDRAGRETFARLLRYIPVFLQAGPIISPGDVAALVDTISKRVGVRKFFGEWLGRYGEAILELRNASVEAGDDSADVNRRVKCLQLIEPELWEPLAIDYLARRGAHREKAQRFFMAYERFIAACLLGAADTKTRRARLEKARASLDDDRALAAALDLTARMRRDLIERIGATSRRDKYRRYLVLRVNAALGEVLGVYDDANVEHVLPATSTAYWRTLFPDPATYSEYAHMIGNYVLVTDRQDQESANRPYAEKRDVYFNRGYPLRAITADIHPIAEWNMQTLDARHERLVGTISRDWELTQR